VVNIQVSYLLDCMPTISVIHFLYYLYLFFPQVMASHVGCPLSVFLPARITWINNFLSSLCTTVSLFQNLILDLHKQPKFPCFFLSIWQSNQWFFVIRWYGWYILVILFGSLVECDLLKLNFFSIRQLLIQGVWFFRLCLILYRIVHLHVVLGVGFINGVLLFRSINYLYW
jgi:hypothetical protein